MRQYLDLINKVLVRSPKIFIDIGQFRGRGIFATSHIKKSEFIFSSLPITAWPQKCHDENMCHICFKCISDCIVCHDKSLEFEESRVFHMMLSKECSESHFESIITKLAHMICTELRMNQPITMHVLKMLAHAEMENGTINLYQSPMLVLRKRLEDMGYETELNSFLDLNWYARVMGILHLNAIKFPRPEGIALYGDVSFLNHSCSATVGLQFDGAEATVIALRDIAKGDELLLNYIDGHCEVDNWDFVQQQNYLQRNYGIYCTETCSCGRLS